ncbi:DUF664 domain-containing protein [Streptomyces sp. NPDC056160]|uniref:mycothiol transferase n=1 Tax=Streptomyces sp. NPDC056160 TaxID=3345731 RepID=UPI0035E021A1
MAPDVLPTLPDGRPVPLTTGAQRPVPASRLAFHRAGLEAKCAGPQGTGRIGDEPMTGCEAGVRWVLIHLIVEYARHDGHAVIPRERIDGVIGA